MANQCIRHNQILFVSKFIIVRINFPFKKNHSMKGGRKTNCQDAKKVDNLENILSLPSWRRLQPSPSWCLWLSSSCSSSPFAVYETPSSSQTVPSANFRMVRSNSVFPFQKLRSYSSESVLGLKLLEKIHVVIDQGKAGGLTATKVGPEAKAGHHIRSHFVHLGQLLSNLLLGDGWSAGMKDINDLYEIGCKWHVEKSNLSKY